MSKNFDQLPEAGALTGTETLAVNQGGVTKWITIDKIKDFLAGLFEAAGAVATAITAHLNAYDHTEIGHGNRAALDNVSGVNTGDQDLTDITPSETTLAVYDGSGADLILTAEARNHAIATLNVLRFNVTYPVTANGSNASLLIPNCPFDLIVSEMAVMCVMIQGGVITPIVAKGSLFGTDYVVDFYSTAGARKTNANMSQALVMASITV